MAGNNPNNISERGANLDGSFQGGDASKAIDATILTAPDIQALIDEISNAVSDANIQLDFSNTQQLKEAIAKNQSGLKYFRAGGGFLGAGNPQRLTDADDLNKVVLQGFYSVGDNIANNPGLSNPNPTYSEETLGVIKKQGTTFGYTTKVSETEFTGNRLLTIFNQADRYSFNLKRVDITRSHDKSSCLVFTNFPSPNSDKESDVAVIFQLFISKQNSLEKNYSRKFAESHNNVDSYEEAFTFDSDSAEVYEANITAFRIGVLTLPTDWSDDIDRVEELENNAVVPFWTDWSSLGEGSSNIVSGSAPITKSIQLFPTNPSNDNLIPEDVLERELWGIRNFLPLATGRYGKITNAKNLNTAFHPGVFKYTGGVTNQPAEVDANEECLLRVHAIRDDDTAKSGYSMIQSLFVFDSAGGNDLRKYERTGYLIPVNDWDFEAANIMGASTYTVVFSNWSKDLNKKEDITGYLITQMVGVGDTAFILSGTDILSYTGNPAKLPNGDANGASVEVSFKSAQLDLSGKLGYSDSIIVRRHDWTIASTQHRLFHTTSEHSSSYTDALLPANEDILAKYQKQASGLWQRTS